MTKSNIAARYAALRVRFVIRAHYDAEGTLARLHRSCLLAEQIGSDRLVAVFAALHAEVVQTIHRNEARIAGESFLQV